MRDDGAQAGPAPNPLPIGDGEGAIDLPQVRQLEADFQSRGLLAVWDGSPGGFVTRAPVGAMLAATMLAMAWCPTHRVASGKDLPMSESAALTVLQQTLWLVAQLSLPILLTALVVGLAISILQAVTQVNEMTLSYVPKIAAIALVLIIAGPWMLQTLLDFTAQLFTSLPNLINH
jgi:flagellar biosynthetic protein FliQ